MISTSDFRKGLKIELEGEPFIIVDFQHVKPGKGGAFVRTRLKSLVSGNMQDKTFRAGERVDTPDLEEREMQFLYQEENRFHFMDTGTFEQLFLTDDQVGDNRNFLTENLIIRILFHNNNPVAIDLPIFVNMTVARTDPGVRGDTASGGSKPATLETGAVIQVPLFINEGDIIKIDTRTRTYTERISAK
ncbi:MAG: elongation factor P [Deltaproteobacteria bacterium]|nr:elongation factor P [Deltaproteobacteria bacterium]MBW2307695.1 elongation factor P [Deltaproteobacteria bacterium]